MSRYPKDWKLIATFVKNQANWKCAKCGRQFEQGERHLQVHHQDYNPENNQISNLISLCSGCHLEKHIRQKGNVTPGQLCLPYYSMY